MAAWKRRCWLQRGRKVVEEGELVGDASSSDRAGEIQEDSLKRVERDGESSVRDGELVGVGLKKSDQLVDTGGERTVLSDVAEKGLHDGCF